MPISLPAAAAIFIEGLARLPRKRSTGVDLGPDVSRAAMLDSAIVSFVLMRSSGGTNVNTITPIQLHELLLRCIDVVGIVTLITSRWLVTN